MPLIEASAISPIIPSSAADSPSDTRKAGRIAVAISWPKSEKKLVIRMARMLRLSH